MTDTFHSIWYHLIISIKNKLPLILPDIENKISEILIECAMNQKVQVQDISVLPEHVHLLLKTSPEINIHQCIRLLLEESKTLIQNNFFPAQSFLWENNYTIFSVSYSQVPKLKFYLSNQKKTHQTKTFKNEISEFIKMHQV